MPVLVEGAEGDAVQTRGKAGEVYVHVHNAPFVECSGHPSREVLVDPVLILVECVLLYGFRLWDEEVLQHDCAGVPILVEGAEGDAVQARGKAGEVYVHVYNASFIECAGDTSREVLVDPVLILVERVLLHGFRLRDEEMLQHDCAGVPVLVEGTEGDAVQARDKAGEVYVHVYNALFIEWTGHTSREVLVDPVLVLVERVLLYGFRLWDEEVLQYDCAPLPVVCAGAYRQTM